MLNGVQYWSVVLFRSYVRMFSRGGSYGSKRGTLPPGGVDGARDGGVGASRRNLWPDPLVDDRSRGGYEE